MKWGVFFSFQANELVGVGHELASLVNRKGDIGLCDGYVLENTNSATTQGFIHEYFVIMLR